MPADHGPLQQPETTPQPLFRHYPLSKAKVLIRVLTPHANGPLWSSPVHQADWLFRGQRDAAWSLVPHALRTDEHGNTPFIKYLYPQVSHPPYEPKAQRDVEVETVLRFASRADRAGHEVPGDRAELRTPGMRPNIGDGREFPHPHWRWIFALAQHHGIPTRFLDWSTSPLIAAYFAAVGAAERVKAGKHEESERLAVWALSDEFINSRTARWDPGPIIITVPTVSNPNLRAQRGVFTLVRYTEGYQATDGTVPSPPPLDELFEDHANIVSARAVRPRFPGPPLIKFSVPVREACYLLHYLHLAGIDAASIYSGLDSVATALAEERLRAVPDPDGSDEEPDLSAA